MEEKSELLKEDVFKRIAEATIFGNLGLFIGSGLSKAVLLDEFSETTALNWQELMEVCEKELEVSVPDDEKKGVSYPEIATKLCKYLSVREKVPIKVAISKLKNKIADLTSWYPNTEKREEYSNYFDQLEPSWIITTNYDLVIESILTGKGVSLGPNDKIIAPKGFIPVYHLHGIRTIPNSIVITQQDYISLFRPNEYRQQKLPLIIKESLTVLIGYSMGDFNVLTAVDWSEHVYEETQGNTPTGIIQFLKVEDDKNKVYIDDNGITILEFNDLSVILKELTEFIEEEKLTHLSTIEKLKTLNDLFKDSALEEVRKFVDNSRHRRTILNAVKENDKYLIVGFMALFSKCIDLTWNRAQERYAWEAYDQNLTMLLDMIEILNVNEMPPLLLHSITDNLNRVSSFIGRGLGDSFVANDTWQLRKGKINYETKRELLNICNTNGYSRLKRLLKEIK